MKQLLIITNLLIFSTLGFSQAFWTETFGSGCNQGTLADGFSSPNGTWQVTPTGTNGTLANVWYVSAAENGEGVGNCGAGCGSNPTLHIGSSLGDFGAAYLSEGFGADEATTDLRAESPIIDCSNQCDIELSFEYLENGDGVLDNHILWYFDGNAWAILDDTPKTALTCAPQGLWSNYSIALPPSANNNPSVRIGFQWVNNNDGLGTDPSIAIYNIQFASNDTEAPVMDCPAELNVYIEPTPNVCEGLIPDLNLSLIPTTDNCTASGDILFSQDVPPGSIINNHMATIDVEVTATDLAGNSSACVITLRALDTLPPVLTCPPTQEVFADNDCLGILDDYLPLTDVVDNCSSIGDITISQTISAGTVISNDQVIEITASDLQGNTNSCSFMVELVDTVSPLITCPSGKTQFTQSGSCDTLILDYTNEIVWSDNCTSSAINMTFSQSPSPGMVVSEGNNLVAITAIDESGNQNQCEFNVQVIDNEAPSIDCPSGQNQIVNSACNISLDDYTAMAVVADNCSAASNISVTQSPSIGGSHNGAGNVISVTLLAEDESGNSNSCIFDVELIDTTPPDINCPSDQIVSTGVSDCNYELPDYSSLIGVTDNCSPSSNITFSQSIPSGTSLSPGVYNIGLNAEDENQNTQSCTFQLTVEDQVPPVIIECAENDTVYADPSCQALVADYEGLSVFQDNCQPAFDVFESQSPLPNTVISETTVVTLSFEDANGNTSTCQMEVVFIDSIPPELNCPSEFIVSPDASCSYQAPDLEPEISGSDNCSSFSNMTFSQSIAQGTLLTGANIIEVTLTDEAGNSRECEIEILPDDGIAPSITCPNDELINNGSDCEYQITDFTGLAVVTDNCPGVIVTQVPSAGAEIGVGETQVTLIAADVAGNTSSCIFNLTVVEDVPPTIDCPDNISTCDFLVDYSAPVGDDNCGVFEIEQVDATGLSSGDEFPVGITEQIFEITDLSGNTEQCSFTVEVLPAPDNAEIFTADTAMCAENSLLLTANDPVNGAGEWMVIAGNGNFNNEFANETAVNNLGVGENIIVWEISTASCGSSTDTITIVVSQEPSQAFTLGPLFKCEDTLINISAGTPSIGQGVWSSLDENITFLDSNAINTVASNLSNGWNELIWTVSNAGCPPSVDTLKIFKNEKPVIFENDTSVCLTDNFSWLSVVNDSTGGDNVSAGWYFIQGSGDIESPNNFFTFVENLRGGENIIVFAQTHQVCGTVSDTIRITVELCDGFNPDIPTVFTPNGDGKNDLFEIENLAVLFPNAEVQIVNRWGSLVFESEGYENPWDGTKFNSGEELPLGTYFYQVKLNDGSDEVLKGPITIVR